MVSCIKIETASLVFAVLSLLTTSLSSLACIALMIHLNILTYVIGMEQKVHESNSLAGAYLTYSVAANISLSVSLAMLLVALAFSIVLTKGLITKKAHLVKAYFIYGVTKNALWSLGAVFFLCGVNNGIGLLSLLGCLIYAIILIMIKRTYMKMVSDGDEQFYHTKLPEQKSIA